jgi:hypothetical protein
MASQSARGHNEADVTDKSQVRLGFSAVGSKEVVLGERACDYVGLFCGFCVFLVKYTENW